MPAIRPFRALRYHPGLVGELSAVIAPPYDVISPEEQEQLYQRSAHNVIRLILGRQSPQDTETDNRYTRARREFDAWRSAGVLRRDAAPALYLVEQAFSDAGRSAKRLGFIALLELSDGVQAQVHRHEDTLSAPKEDRTKLLRAVPASLEPIFCVYPDQGGWIQSRLTQAAGQQAPDAQAVFQGDTVKLWALKDPALIGQVAAQLASSAVLIADGHHRFEVAYAERARHDTLMAYFASMEDPGLVVRPIHRLIRCERLALERLNPLCRFAPAQDAAALQRWLRQPQASAATAAGQGTGEALGRFGLYDGNGLHQVTLQAEPLARWLQAPAVPAPLAALDVSLLHHVLLPALGIERAHGPDVWFTAETEQAIRAVDQGQAALAWFLRAIPLEQVYGLASQGLRLAPKSTYFFPKVPSGLVMNLLDAPGD